MQRREFLKNVAVAGAATGVSSLLPNLTSALPSTVSPDNLTANRVPRWRGFNLQGRFAGPEDPYNGPAYSEFDFAAMAEWGFNFARLPLSYWTWGSREDWSLIREDALKRIDQGIALGRQYGIHINLNFHRIPGYCINDRGLEPADLFTDYKPRREKALAAAAFHWRTFARRYRSIPSRELSFDLINEPPKMRSYEGMLEERYDDIVRTLVTAIREEDPNRLIFADGMNIGQAPVLGVVDLGIVQSTRGYLPKAVSHYTATWVPKDEFESMNVPTWPLKDDKGRTWDKERLRQEYIVRYQPLVEKGVPIHVGEWGVFNQTPHPVALAWMKDSLSLWHEAGWGFALWNLRGSFGVLDSERTDVKYENYKGHQLDRQMLDLMRQY